MVFNECFCFSKHAVHWWNDSYYYWLVLCLLWFFQFSSFIWWSTGRLLWRLNDAFTEKVTFYVQIDVTSEWILQLDQQCIFRNVPKRWYEQYNFCKFSTNFKCVFILILTKPMLCTSCTNSTDEWIHRLHRPNFRRNHWGYPHDKIPLGMEWCCKPDSIQTRNQRQPFQCYRSQHRKPNQKIEFINTNLSIIYFSIR